MESEEQAVEQSPVITPPLKPYNKNMPGNAFAPTTHVTNLDGETIAWDEVRKGVEGHTYTIPEAAKHFRLKLTTVRNRAIRHSWKFISAPKLNKLRQRADWDQRAEEHRDLAFIIAHESIKKFKPRAPKTFRELEAADKVARRAAGLDNTEVVQQTLVQINEAIDSEEPLVTEAVLLDEESDEPQAQPNDQTNPNSNTIPEGSSSGDPAPLPQTE